MVVYIFGHGDSNKLALLAENQFLAKGLLLPLKLPFFWDGVCKTGAQEMISIAVTKVSQC